jgi:ribose-phosphate pyrophosphokinase
MQGPQQTQRTTSSLLIGDANPELGNEVALLCGMRVAAAEIAAFADGETRICISDDVDGSDLYVIQSTSPPTNEHLMHLALLADAASLAGAARITAVVPYFGYARQDVRHGVAEPLAARLAGRILVAAGVDRLVSLELHSAALESAFDVPLIALKADELLLPAIRSWQLADLTVVAPDAGAVKRAQRYASALDVPLALVAKSRPRPDVATPVHVLGDVAGRNCLLVDDMASTGGTLAGAAQALGEAGAGDIHALFIHRVMAAGALDRIRAAGIKRVLTTDSVRGNATAVANVEVVSIAPLLARSIGTLAKETV